MKLLDKNKLIRPCESDGRAREFIRPTRIMLTKGDVTNAEHLLADTPNQVAVAAEECTTLRNSGGEHAALLFDLGCEIHGCVRFVTQNATRTPGKGSGEHTSADTKEVRVRVRFGESVSEALTPVGVKGATTDHASRDFITALRWLSYEDTNESGFRFVYVELLDDHAELQLKTVFGVLIYRDIEYIGSFESSDPLLDKIYDTSAYTAHLNMQGYLWDGIKRDRLVWIGDMHPEVMTICTVFGANEVVPRSLDYVRDHTPVTGWMNGISSYSLWWVMCHYDYYLQNGDKAYLCEQKEYMSALLTRLCGLVDDEGRERFEGGKFLDWPSKGDDEAVNAGYQGLLCMTLKAGSMLAAHFGDEKLAKLCADKSALMHNYCPPTVSKQGASLLALSGILDAKRADDEVMSVDGARRFSTFYSYYMLTTKALAGNYTGALDAMREYYGAMLDLGATTFWEDFNLDWVPGSAGIDEIVPEGKKDIHGDFGAHCYIGLRHSLCHGWSSGPTAFLARHILGIKVLEPGCKKVEIKPNLAGLTYAKGSYPTPYGPISVYVDEKGVKIDAPAEVEIIR
ncbi:MAG: alpha-L-rhamnosidase [Clostridiales bacterium]|nr:alpha-L-rhamnosidase [Clostridiales bacterium]